MFFRCADVIIRHWINFCNKRREYNINLDITGTSELSGYVNAVYVELLKDSRNGHKKNGIVAIDLDKMGTGNFIKKLKII